jgi:hypothetical protein
MTKYTINFQVRIYARIKKNQILHEMVWNKILSNRIHKSELSGS